ncbi:MAG: hypothetical protein CMJ49_13790 [Planctomycetaceae bacterium]|nr:hypothetical protein [Planctomycetaceae bacterium]
MTRLQNILRVLKKINTLGVPEPRRIEIRIFPWIYRQYRERLTHSGRYVLIGAVGSIIAGSFPEYMVGSYLFSFFVALLAVALAVSLFIRPRARLQRDLPPRCVAGATVPYRIRATNTTKRDAHDIGVAELRPPHGIQVSKPAQYVGHIPAGQSHTFDFELTAADRGSYSLPGPAVTSAFPFGLTQARRFSPHHQELHVYPAFHPLTELNIPAGLRYQPGGLALTSQVGQSMEFIGTREYETGDRLRDLHPRSWARVGYPVVRQYQEEYLTRIAMIVDTYAPRKRDRPALEATLSTAAAIADYLSRQEYIVDLFAAGPELYVFQAGRSLGYLDNILDILACIDPCDHDPLDRIAPRLYAELRQTSTVISLFMRWDDPRRNLVRDIRELGVATHTIVINNDHDDARAAAADDAQHLTVAQVQHGVEQL